MQNCSDAHKNEESVTSKNALDYLQKVWAYRRHLVVEPLIFFCFLGSIINIVAIESFPLIKACRVNLGYNQLVCDALLNKSSLGINCDEYISNNSFTGLIFNSNLTMDSESFNNIVCKAEIEIQQLTSNVSSKRGPIVGIFVVIVVLFAGGWADRYNKRKICMILPIVGEILAFSSLMISSIFFESISMEFGYYIQVILPAMFGGMTLMFMAINSYISLTTPEEDRVFRFGVLVMFITVIPFIGQPISGLILLKLGYTLSFALGVCLNLISILYTIFILKDIPPPPKDIPATSSISIHPNPPQGTEITETNIVASNTETANMPVARSFFREFFDPSLIMDCIKLLYLKRRNNGRILLILLVLGFFLSIGPTIGESDYWFRYTLRKLNWNGNDYSAYLTFASALCFVGTFIGTAILSKMLKVPDSALGILSASTTVVARILYAHASDTKSMYIAEVVDMFSALRYISIKAIGSSIVENEELTKMYSIFGISEPIGQFIFTPLYGIIYIHTVETFPGAFFLFSDVFHISNVIVLSFCYFLLKRYRNNAVMTNITIEEESKPLQHLRLVEAKSCMNSSTNPVV